MSHTPQQKKLAIVVCAWPPQGGGIGNNAYYHARELARRGWAVTAYTLGRSSRVDDVPVESLWAWPRYGHAGLLWSLLWRLRSHDIIHLYYPFFGSDILVLFAAWIWRKRLIVHYQMEAVGEGWQHWVFQAYQRCVLPLLVRRAVRIIVLSADHRDHSPLAVTARRRPARYVVIPNGVDVDSFSPMPPSQELRRQLGLLSGDHVALFVGGLDRQHYFKGVDIALHSLRVLRDQQPHLRLVIVGDGDRRSDFEELAHQLEISDRVLFTGWVDNSRLADYYRLADVFILPSTAATESFGIVTAEAQACGVPAIVSDWPGSRATIEPGVTGLVVPPSDIEALAMAIDRLLSDDALREQMSQAAVQRARAHYGWSGIGDQLEQLYRAL